MSWKVWNERSRSLFSKPHVACWRNYTFKYPLSDPLALVRGHSSVRARVIGCQSLCQVRRALLSCRVLPLRFCQVEFLLGGMNECLHGVISWPLCLLDNRIVIPVTRLLLPRKSDCPRESDPDHRSRVLIYISLHAQMILRRFPPRLKLSMYADPICRKCNNINGYWMLMQNGVLKLLQLNKESRARSWLAE